MSETGISCSSRTEARKIENAAHGPPVSSRRISALDGVRGIAILGVLLTHSYHSIADAVPPTARSIITGPCYLGVYGVDLFFVLSGFLITGILLDTKQSPHYFRNFYARRFLRLFPVYYGYLLGVAVVLPWVHRLAHTSMSDYDGNWWWYLCYLSNWKSESGAHDPFLGHFWSLAVEEQFYLIWPAVILLLSRRRLAYVCTAAIIGALAARCILIHFVAYWQVYRLTPARFDALALGALVALAFRSPYWKGFVTRYSATIGVSGAAAFCILALYAHSVQWRAKPIQTAGPLAIGVAFVGLVSYAVVPRAGWAARVLESQFLTAFGRYSYTIYVIHVVVLAHTSWIGAFLTRYLGQSRGLWIAIAVFLFPNAASFFLAKLSWHYFESPILRYKAKFRDSPALASVPGPAPITPPLEPA